MIIQALHGNLSYNFDLLCLFENYNLIILQTNRAHRWLHRILLLLHPQRMVF